MYKVYIEDNVVVFSVRPVGDPSFVTFRPAAGEPLSVTKLLQKVQNSKRLAVVSDDIEQVFADFRASQRFIEAGGGVTADPQGNLLLIFRNGRWDLPKGKLEPGERIEDCAVREVGDTSIIYWGQIYVVLLDDYRMVKYLRRHPDDSKVVLRSANPAYDDIDVPKSAIRGLFFVSKIVKVVDAG